MIKNSLVLITLFCVMFTFGQEEKKIDLLISDASWGKEIIPMPIHFAPKIPFVGIEEIRFAPGWSKQDDDGFWSYAFVWDINLDKKLSATDVETYLQYYFDGLMEGVNKEKDKIIPKTIALFLSKENSAGVNEFKGKLQVYNSFHTRDVMQLCCTVQQYYCLEKKRSMVLFRFSPKAFEHRIWNELNTVKLREKPCDH